MTRAILEMSLLRSSITFGKLSMCLAPSLGGVLSFALVEIPVELHTATHSQNVFFNLLHACASRVRNRSLCPVCNEVVEPEQGVNQDDGVVDGQKHAGHIVLTFRRSAGFEYKAMLVLPENFLDKTPLSIVRNKGITLRELGELDNFVICDR